MIIQGKQNIKYGLYNVQFKIETNTSRSNDIIGDIKHQKVNVIIQVDKNKAKLAQFLHGTLFSPSISTLKKVISNNHLLTWPGIKKLNFTKLVANIIPMTLGHLNQERKNLQSTKFITTKTNIDNMENESECYFLQHEKEKCNIAFSTHIHQNKLHTET